MAIAILFVHIVVCLAVITVALMTKRFWAAGMSALGLIAGYALAIVPLGLTMLWGTMSTGFDAGNAGVLFVCTVPTFPIIGIAAGAAVGYSIDARQRKTGCSNCGYNMRGINSDRCPECGAPRSCNHAAQP